MEPGEDAFMKLKNRMSGKWAASLASLMVYLVCIAPAGLAQNISGSILGTVTYNSGGVIASAPVTVTNKDIGVEFKS